MTAQIYASELFSLIQTVKSTKEKVELLQKHNSPIIQSVLYHMFHPDLKYRITKIPDYKKNMVPAGLGDINMEQALSKIYLIIDGHHRAPVALTDEKRNILTIQLLENMQWKEAEIYEDIIQRKSRHGLTKAIVMQAYPGLLG